ncbi:MAG: hypothetical protein IT342_19165 [Candidatus Melainabacteria bacterium]|nr:hypothetical protein [Candidatus Melainabacteria bacterium]
MSKNSIFVSAMAILVAVSLSLPADASKQKKTKKQKLQNQSAQDSPQPQQGQYDSSGGAGTSSDYGSSSASGNSRVSGNSDSISMFKAGNTSLPSGTYAMTNVSTGAAFVVIVDDSGDMRAQDARAMNLVDDSKSAKHSSKNKSNGNSGGFSYRNSDNNSDYNDSQYGSLQNSDSDNYNASKGSPPILSPQQTPASAVLPTPVNSGHPLLQGSSQSSVYPSAQPSGLLPNLFTQQNPLSQGQPANGQIPGGVKGALQAELQRQLGKQIMRHAPKIEQQVRKVIKGIN